MHHTGLLPNLYDNIWVLQQRTKINGYTRSGSIIGRGQILLYPSGGAVGTAADMAKFAMALFPKEGEPSILFENFYTALKFQPSVENILNNDENIFYGFFLFSEKNTEETFSRAIGHTGSTNAFRSLLILDIDNNMGVVVLENTRYGIRTTHRFIEFLLERIS